MDGYLARQLFSSAAAMPLADGGSSTVARSLRSAGDNNLPITGTMQ